MLDHEIGRHLQNALTELGLEFMGNKEPVKIEKGIKKPTSFLKTGPNFMPMSYSMR